MSDINPILDQGPAPEQPMEVPEYVLEARKKIAKEALIQDVLIQMSKSIKKKKVPVKIIGENKTSPKECPVSSKQFNSFIDRKIPGPPKDVLGATVNISKMGDCAILDFRNLIELAKSASKDQDTPKADLFYKLKELKEKEVGIIHNYLTKHR